MPLYMCNTREAVVGNEAKSKIAADITEIHCRITDAPPTFVHAFFLDQFPLINLGEKSVVLVGNIRAGRTPAQKEQMIEEMRQSIHLHSGIALEEIEVRTNETPASWVMEGGDLLPEPGEEADWLLSHETKLAASKL